MVYDFTRQLVELNHHIYHDRYFTNAKLASDLYNDIYTCGIVNPNHNDLPQQLHQKESVIKKTLIPNRGDSVSYEKKEPFC
jgi:hypothetical protein